MSDYTIVKLADAPDVLGEYPGEMRMLAGPLETEQVAFTHRRLPAQTGGKGSYGHRHRTQEEVYFVISGRLQFKLGDEVTELGEGAAIRVGKDVYRSVWNEGPDDAVIVICSTRLPEGTEDEWELQEDFWPEV
jgi:mannose-6-phosphate isomerase-like protein (cupin superfamily)